MAMTTATGASPSEATGLSWLGTGAGLGLAGGIAALLLPTAFLWFAVHDPNGFFTTGPQLVEANSILVLAGAIIFLISLMLYRRSFLAIRKIDRRYDAAAALAILGTVGFLLVVVTALILLASSNSIQNCLQSQAIPSFSCLQSGAPWAVYTGLAGFWLGWLGGIGIVVGVTISASHYHQRVLYGGGALYAILLLLLVGPFLAALYSFPGAEFLLLGAAVLTVLAPAVVLEGALRAARPGPSR